MERGTIKRAKSRIDGSVRLASVLLGAARAPGRRGRAAGRLAGSFAAELAIEQRLGTDHEDDAHYLHAHREAERSSSAMGRHDMISAMSSSVIPSKCSTFSAGDQRPPAGPDIGGARPARQGDDAAVLRAEDALALSLKRGACHRLGYVAGRPAPRQARSPSRASACVCLQRGLARWRQRRTRCEASQHSEIGSDRSPPRAWGRGPFTNSKDSIRPMPIMILVRGALSRRCPSLTLWSDRCL
jgi:hypothetical protein